MLAPPENQTLVLAALGDRFELPLGELEPNLVFVTTTTEPRVLLRAFERAGGAVVAVVERHLALVQRGVTEPDRLPTDLRTLAGDLGGTLFSGVARSGVDIPEPADPVTVLDTSDPRLPEWVHGHFVGAAWCVLDAAGSVLSTAVLKRYDPRIREIAVGTAEQARGRGLARSVVAAAARAVLAEGRGVLYNHAVDNLASASVAEAVGLHEIGRFHVIFPGQLPLDGDPPF